MSPLANLSATAVGVAPALGIGRDVHAQTRAWAGDADDVLADLAAVTLCALMASRHAGGRRAMIARELTDFAGLAVGVVGEWLYLISLS